MKNLPWILVLLLAASNVYFLFFSEKTAGTSGTRMSTSDTDSTVVEPVINIDSAQAWISRFNAANGVNSDTLKKNSYITRAAAQSITKNFDGIFIKRGMKFDGSVVDLAFGSASNSGPSVTDALELPKLPCICRPCCVPPPPQDSLR